MNRDTLHHNDVVPKQLTLLVQPATGGSWEYSSGTFREVRGVSSKFRASNPLGSETSGTMLVGVGSNRDISDEICGVITGMVCSNWGWGCCFVAVLVGMVTMSSKPSPSKSVLQVKKKRKKTNYPKYFHYSCRLEKFQCQMQIAK